MDAGRKRETLMKHIEFQDKNGSFIIHDPENYSGRKRTEIQYHP